MDIIVYDLCGADPAIRFSPYCWRVKMALAHKGIGYETVATPFTRIKQMTGGFSSTVPVIDHRGKLVRDSWDIGVYLDEAYPDRPSLFGGPNGVALTEFYAQWSVWSVSRIVHPWVVKDIHDRLSPADQAYFRESREKRLGGKLEALQAKRDAGLAEFREGLWPLRKTLGFRPFLGGASPLFADYILFGVFQWVRVVSPYQLLADDDPVKAWFERCLDLYDGLGRSMPAAADQPPPR